MYNLYAYLKKYKEEKIEWMWNIHGPIFDKFKVYTLVTHALNVFFFILYIGIWV